MKLLTIFTLLAASPLFAGTPVGETIREFSAAGDFNGDTIPDVLVLDKETGLYRVGYGSASGALSFAEGRPSGFGGVTGFAVGKLSGTAQDSFAAAAPAANRAHVLSPQTTGYTEPKAVQAGVGAQLLAAFDLPAGALPTAEDDLVSFATLDPTMGTQIRTLRSNAGSWTLLTETNVAQAEVTQGNPLTPAAGSTPLFTYVSREGTTDGFHAWQLTGAAAAEVLTISAMPPGRSWVSGIFETPRAEVIFYTPGQPTVGVRRILPGAPWTLGAEATATFAEPVEQLAIVNDTTGTKLLARFTSGSVALFGYTQALGFSAPQFITPTGVTGVLSGLVPMPGNAFQLLFATAPGQASSKAVTWSKTSSGWTQTGISTMPALRPLTASANVMLLAGAPFRAPNVELIRSYRSADWATSASIGAGPFSVTAQSASYGGPSQGIGTPAIQTLGIANAVPGGVAVNQQQAQFSLFAFNSTLGPAVDDVSIDPEPGTYGSAIQISFSGAGPGSTVFMRRNASAPFIAWSAASAPWIYARTTVDYYVRTATGTVSPTKSALYTFDRPPALQDADGDGVPDFAELARGLHPAGGADSDGDSFSDIDEIAAGTDPNDPASKPPANIPALNTMLFDIAAELQTPVAPVPATSSGIATGTAAGGTVVTLHDPFGNPVAMGEMISQVVPSGTPVPLALGRLSSVGVLPEIEYLVARTAEHFDVTPAGTNVRRGREMIGLIPVPPREPWHIETPTTNTKVVRTAWSWGGVNWSMGTSNWDTGLGAVDRFDPGWTASQLSPQWGGLDANFTAAAWENQFRAATNPGLQPYAIAVLTPVTSISALIACKVLSEQFAARSNTSIETTWHGTAVAFDEARRTAFENFRHSHPAHPSAPAFRVEALLRSIDTELAGNDAGALALKKIARAVYARHETLTPEALGSLPMPLAALDVFVRTGALPPEYNLAEAGLTGAELVSGTAKILQIAAALNSRPVATFFLQTRNIANPPGLTLLSDGGGTVYALLDEHLAAVALPADLPPGSPIVVSAYTDLPAVAGFLSLEVLSINLDALPQLVGEDSDGDLLADEWELRNFGSLIHDGFGSVDGSVYTLAHEYLEGTDPRNASSSPPGAPVELRFTDLQLTVENHIPRLRVRWPAAYADAVAVSFDKSPDLLIWDRDPGFSATHSGAGIFTRNIVFSGSQRFFLPRVSLKR